ncbi:MAG: hypothetical protein WBB27_06340 [Maribacter sp.]
MDKYPKYIPEEQQELFERFLMDEMSIKEKKSFEIKIAGDKNLKNSFDEFKSLFETVEEVGLRHKLKDFHNALENGEEPQIRLLNPSKYRFGYRIAASIIILIGLGSIWFLNNTNSNVKLYEVYYFQDPGLPTVMGSSDNYNFYEAMVDYKQGDFKVAIEKWEKLLVAKPENDTLNYFLGVSHLANGQFEKGLIHLNKNENDSSSRFFSENNFYLGLAHLRLNQLTEAKIYLGKSKMPESKEILEALKK